MDKAKDFSCGPVLSQPSSRDVGAAKREVPCLLARAWGDGVLYCFLPVSAWDCGQCRGSRLGGLKGGNVRQLQKMNQPPPGTVLDKEEKNPGLEEGLANGRHCFAQSLVW